MNPLDQPIVPVGEMYDYLGLTSQQMLRFRNWIERERPGSGGGTAQRFITPREMHQLYVFLSITEHMYIERSQWMWKPAMELLAEGTGVGYIVVHGDDEDYHWFTNLDDATRYVQVSVKGFRMSAIVSLELPEDVQEWLIQKMQARA